MDPKALWMAEIVLAGLTLFIRSADNPVSSNDWFLFSFLLVVGTLVSLSNEYSGSDLHEDGSLDDLIPSFSWISLLFAAFIFIVGYAGEAIDLSWSIGIGIITLVLCTIIRFLTVWPRWEARKLNRKQQLAQLQKVARRFNQSRPSKNASKVTIITEEPAASRQSENDVSVDDSNNDRRRQRKSNQ